MAHLNLDEKEIEIVWLQPEIIISVEGSVTDEEGNRDNSDLVVGTIGDDTIVISDRHGSERLWYHRDNGKIHSEGGRISIKLSEGDQKQLESFLEDNLEWMPWKQIHS